MHQSADRWCETCKQQDQVNEILEVLNMVISYSSWSNSFINAWNTVVLTLPKHMNIQRNLCDTDIAGRSIRWCNYMYQKWMSADPLITAHWPIWRAPCRRQTRQEQEKHRRRRWPPSCRYAKEPLCHKHTCAQVPLTSATSGPTNERRCSAFRWIPNAWC